MLAIATTIKLALLSIIFVITGGAVFSGLGRRHKTLVILASIVAAISSVYLLRELYHDLRIQIVGDLSRGTPVQGPTNPASVAKPPASLGPALPPCTLGATVGLSDNRVQLNFLVVEDGAAVQAIITRLPETNHGSQLLQGISDGKIKRFSDSGNLKIGIMGVRPEDFPREIPYLQNRGICRGMTTATLGASDVIEFTVPVGDWDDLAQTSVVLPRDVLAGAQRPHFCVEANFPLYRRGMIEGPYKDKTNVRCGFAGATPGTELRPKVGDGVKG